MEEYKDFIGIYNNAFTEDFCNDAMAWFDFCHSQGLTLNRQNGEGVSPLEKKDDFLFVPKGTWKLEQSGVQFLQAFRDTLFTEIYPMYKKHNPILDHVSDHDVFDFKIQKTEPSGGYHLWHCEHMSATTSKRILAWSLNLNDDFEAGETEFLHQQRRVKPEKGTLCIFPAGITHVHRGNPPIGGNKYIATGWLEY